MVEHLIHAHSLPPLAAIFADPSGPRKWIDAHGWGDFAIACTGFVFLSALAAVLFLIWGKIDRLTQTIAQAANAQEKALRSKANAASKTPAPVIRDEDQDRRLRLLDDQLRETSEMVREFLPVLQKIKANQAAAAIAQTSHFPDPPSSRQLPQETRRVPFEETYNAVFADPTRDERLPGIKDQFRVNFRDKTYADRNPEASSPLVRDSSGWLSVFVEEGTETLYLAPSLAFRAGTLMNTQVSKLSSLFTFGSTPVTRLDRAATVRRVGHEFHLDQPGSMS